VEKIMLKNPEYQRHEADSSNSCTLPNEVVKDNILWPTFEQGPEDDRLDHFIHRDGKIFAGTHLIIDLWEAERLDDLAHMEAAMRLAVEKSKATLLHIHLHHFTPNGGISGVAVLAESHISVHTWPEKNYAAFDVFMCGDAEPEQAVAVFQSFFSPDSCQVDNISRGQIK
jgi:S-adenosylmethionine decarboxylase